MLIGTAEAARLIGCHRDSIRHMINQGRLKAQKVGRDWLIEEADLETVKEQPQFGRPRGVEMEIKEKYKVEGKTFRYLKDALKHRRELINGRDDLTITIYKAETGYSRDVNAIEWIPFR
jgi:excisionase family DNA binding protein